MNRLLIALALLAQPAAGQYLTATGGASSLLETYGARLDYRYAPLSGWLSLGWNHGLRAGTLNSATLFGTQLEAGDRFFTLAIDTDVFDRGYFFDGRGLTVSRHTGAQSWTLFGGEIAGEFSTAFVRTFHSEQAAAAFFYERKAGARLTFHSSNILSRGLTSIQSLNIALAHNWTLDGSAGMGSGREIVSAASSYKNRWLDVTGSWTGADDRFQRLRASSSVFSERRGANIRARLSPLPYLSFVLGHENIVAPVALPLSPVRVSLDSLAASGSVAGFGLNATWSWSQSGVTSTQTQFLTASRRLSSRFTVHGAAVRSRNNRSLRTDLYLGTLQGKISSRLSLDGTFTRNASATSFSAGGEFLSNWVVVGIHNQAVVNQLAGGFNGAAIVQAWTLSLRFHLPGGIGLHCDSSLDGNGRVRYTAYAEGLALLGAQETATSSPAIHLDRYTLRGKVVDERGAPVEGMALQILGEILYTDSAGSFSLRVKKAGGYPVEVRPDQALNRANWEPAIQPAVINTGQQNVPDIVLRHRP